MPWCFITSCAKESARGANCHAATWLEGNYARILYPKANLTSQRITDFLESIGDWDKMNSFFDRHIEWVKSQWNDPAVLVDSTGAAEQHPLSADCCQQS